MISPGARLAILALLLGACVGAWAGWTWQDWRYGQQLAERAGSYKAERESAAAAVIAQLQIHQDQCEDLEARLATSAQTHGWLSRRTRRCMAISLSASCP